MYALRTWQEKKRDISPASGPWDNGGVSVASSKDGGKPQQTSSYNQGGGKAYTPGMEASLNIHGVVMMEVTYTSQPLTVPKPYREVSQTQTARWAHDKPITALQGGSALETLPTRESDSNGSKECPRPIMRPNGDFFCTYAGEKETPSHQEKYFPKIILRVGEGDKVQWPSRSE